jgi:hypothetical protein
MDLGKILDLSPVELDVINLLLNFNNNLSDMKLNSPLQRKRTHKCNYLDCNRRFVSFNSLHKHKLTHCILNEYKCNICGLRFTKKGNFAVHRKKCKIT